ncbi:MAG: hypothetical protein KW788_01825 [Candidatus Doudnabacteria bacterium]|nr:hypothetical protein [Candidatus Doudnabacteria bacterium]
MRISTFDFDELKRLGVIGPYPDSDYAVQWLLGYLKRGIHDYGSSPAERVKKFNLLQQMAVGQTVLKLKASTSSRPMRAGILLYFTGRPELNEMAEEISDCPFLAKIKWNKNLVSGKIANDAYYVRIDQLVLEKTMQPLWPIKSL